MSNSKSLYQIAERYRLIEQLLIESGGELTPELEQDMRLVQSRLTEKAEAYCHIIAELRGNNETISAEVQRLRALSARNQRVIDRLEAALLRAITEFGRTIPGTDRKEISTPLHRITTRRSTCVEVVDPDEIPARFQQVRSEVSVDKRAIKKEVKENGEVPGVRIVTRSNLSIQ